MLGKIRNFLFGILCFFIGHNYVQYVYDVNFVCKRCHHKTHFVGNKRKNLVQRMAIGRRLHNFWYSIDEGVITIGAVVVIITVIVLLIVAAGMAGHNTIVTSCRDTATILQVAWAYDNNAGCLLQAPDGRFIQDEYYNYTGGN